MKSYFQKCPKCCTLYILHALIFDTGEMIAFAHFETTINYYFFCLRRSCDLSSLQEINEKKRGKRAKNTKTTTKLHNTSFILLCCSRFEIRTRMCWCFLVLCVHFLIGLVSNKFLTLGYSIGHYSVPHNIPLHCCTGLSELNYDTILVNRFCMGQSEATKKKNNEFIRNS